MGDVNRFFGEQATPLGKWEEWKAQNADKSTPKLYQGGLDYFMKYHSLESYGELYELQLEAQRRGATDPLCRYVVPEMIRKAVSHRIKVDGVSGTHAKNIKSAVVKFMNLCGFEDFTAKLPRGITKMGSNGGSEIITPRELATVLSVADDLQKTALTLTLKDSGLRIGDVISLDYGDVAEAMETKTEFYYLKKLTQKTGDRAQTVLGPEALKALRDWIRYRRDRGETLGDGTPLFTKYRLAGEAPKANKDPEANLEARSEARLTMNNASTLMSRLFSKAGYSDVTAHGLRKLHSTYLGVGEDRLSEPMIARLEGKVISDSREPYKIYAPSDLIEAYGRNYHQIQVWASESKRVRELEERLAALEAAETRRRERYELLRARRER